MGRDAAYYMSRGFDDAAARYFASGRRKVISAAANLDFTLTLRFDNGEVRIYDAKPLLKTGTVFAPFAKFENFRRVYVDDTGAVAWDIDPCVDSSVIWSNKVDLSPDTCYLESRPTTEDEDADDLFCQGMLEEYENDPDPEKDREYSLEVCKKEWGLA